MELLIIVAVLALFGLAAQRWGVDTRFTGRELSAS
jgi:hypothetical protein